MEELLKKDFLGTEDAKENESVLDYKTKTLYERLILSQHVLKCTATEAIEIVSGLDEVKDLNSQNDRLFLDDIRGKVFVDKIIVKYINRKNKRIMYWSPCNIIDFFNVSGIKFNPTGTTVFEYDSLPRNEQSFFYGKDIIKCLLGDIEVYGEAEDDNLNALQTVLQTIVDQYINTTYPINDMTFYRLFMKISSETGEVYVGIRHISLSNSTPQKDANKANVKKTVLHLNH